MPELAGEVRRATAAGQLRGAPVIVDALERHSATCRECNRFHVCAEAAALLTKLVELSLPVQPAKPEERS